MAAGNERKLWVCKAEVQAKENTPYFPCVAIATGLYNVDHFVYFDGTIADKVYDYKLFPAEGSITLSEQNQ